MGCSFFDTLVHSGVFLREESGISFFLKLHNFVHKNVIVTDSRTDKISHDNVLLNFELMLDNLSQTGKFTRGAAVFFYRAAPFGIWFSSSDTTANFAC